MTAAEHGVERHILDAAAAAHAAGAPLTTRDLLRFEAPRVRRLLDSGLLERQTAWHGSIPLTIVVPAAAPPDAPTRNSVPYSEYEDQVIRRGFARREPVAEIAAALQRSQSGVRNRAVTLGLAIARTRPIQNLR